MMAEEEAPKPVPAEVAETKVDFTPPPPAEEPQGFDFTQYSITISIFFLFVGIKTLSYFGFLDSD